MVVGGGCGGELSDSRCYYYCRPPGQSPPGGVAVVPAALTVLILSPLHSTTGSWPSLVGRGEFLAVGRTNQEGYIHVCMTKDDVRIVCVWRGCLVRRLDMLSLPARRKGLARWLFLFFFFFLLSLSLCYRWEVGLQLQIVVNQSGGCMMSWIGGAVV